MFTITSFVILIYDLLLTFPDEVQFVWTRKLSFVTGLWTVNRYLWPLAYIVVTVAFHDPRWSTQACERYILYPQCVRLVASVVIGTYFILRVYAIYSNSKTVLVISIGALCGLIAVKIWAFLDGTRLDLPPGISGCFLVPKHPSEDRFLYTYLSEVVFDCGIFIGTIVGILRLQEDNSIVNTLLHSLSVSWIRKKYNSRPSILAVLATDGCVYFGLVSAVNLTNVFMYGYAPSTLKDMVASLSTLLSSLLTSRLMLHLFKNPSTLVVSTTDILSTLCSHTQLPQMQFKSCEKNTLEMDPSRDACLTIDNVTWWSSHMIASTSYNS
ncbi:hypothetical protein BDP27DRAFT_1432693 [Rhodocollybia butyracea]|uniref:DUF6533 domain-containing protein n=1 Tax=Rhodocollybia butyracea TaxID=206335 RepID=A0A9P5TYK3_9AGAR|nr:hypothetical protein BDP27DRAFT_1432693 [Rhodocollybia butyracea]